MHLDVICVGSLHVLCIRGAQSLDSPRVAFAPRLTPPPPPPPPATLGNVDSGKSTLVGVLTRDILDDGNGRARSLVFRHAHEKSSGRTSAVGIELMGLDALGKVIRVEASENRARRSAAIRLGGRRIVTFCDLAGHERYLKTTIAGLTGLLPDYALVIVGLNMGVGRMTREHLGLAAALDVTPIVICTKSDIAPPDIAKATLER